VRREVVAQGRGRPGAAVIGAAPRIRTVPPRAAGRPPSEDLARLGAGEAEAIALAARRRLTLRIDDRAGREAAAARGVDVTGSAGVLLVARPRGLIAAVRPLSDDLVASGRRLDETLSSRVLTLAGDECQHGAPPGAGP
jgi:hypothetical protein